VARFHWSSSNRPPRRRRYRRSLGRGSRSFPPWGIVKDLPEKPFLGRRRRRTGSPFVHRTSTRSGRRSSDILNSRGRRRPSSSRPTPTGGEAIAWHIADAIRADSGEETEKGRRKKAKLLPAERRRRPFRGCGTGRPAESNGAFHEITKKVDHRRDGAIPAPSTSNKFDAQQARRILDRIVGYTLSPAPVTKVRAGPVGREGEKSRWRSRLVCGREKETRRLRGPRSTGRWFARWRGGRPPLPVEAGEVVGRKFARATREETAVLARGGERSSSSEVRKNCGGGRPLLRHDLQAPAGGVEGAADGRAWRPR